MDILLANVSALILTNGDSNFDSSNRLIAIENISEGLKRVLHFLKPYFVTNQKICKKNEGLLLSLNLLIRI